MAYLSTLALLIISYLLCAFPLAPAAPKREPGGADGPAAKKRELEGADGPAAKVVKTENGS